IIKFAEKDQKLLDKQSKREIAQLKMEKFLKNLNKEPKPVKKDLANVIKIIELNPRYHECSISIQKIKYQQIYRTNGMF
ncbi:MAG: hypothetical protein ACFFE4_15425, partial [Candidatus Thorarchaeota archaeon]